MRIRVKFFSLLRDATGVKEATVELRDGADVSELLDYLYAKWPKLREEDDIIVLVNGKPSSTVLKEGDEVALIPPVSGG